MRLLLDNNLSPRLVPLLVEAGDVAHVGTLGLGSATDEEVLAAARTEGRVLVSADTDFGQILARTRATAPSVVLVRRVVGRRAGALADLLIQVLLTHTGDLASGCVLAVHEDSVRIRRLPLA